MTTNIKVGTRVRLKTRTISGWRGTATMLDFDRAIKDGSRDALYGCVEACRHEWVIMRDQTPNPDHADAVAAARGENDVGCPAEL